jgi:type IV pilus assembly protein PilN
MRQLESSGWMTKPDLNIIEAKEGNPGLPYEFTLKVKLSDPSKTKGTDATAPADAAAAAAAAPAAPATVAPAAVQPASPASAPAAGGSKS